MIKNIKTLLKSQPTSDGAGVKLKRVFGYYEQGLFDPFLLLDEFGSDNPDEYIAGFPWHPHRGIETVTYMLGGLVEHSDSLGNSGVISTGDIQWMTAGSGIVHQEMPKRTDDRMRGFQLWVNLPASNKMMTPRYQDIPSSQIKTVNLKTGGTLKVIAGEYDGIKGPVVDIIANPVYFDIRLNEGEEFDYFIDNEHNAFIYVYEGKLQIGNNSTNQVPSGSIALLDEGDTIKVNALESGSKFILVSGIPLNEPITWGGPIVMNTKVELELAFREYRNGTFLKSKK